MRLLWLVVLLSAFAKTTPAQVHAPLAEALGLATVASENIWGAAENPATLPAQTGFTALGYGLTPAQVAELSRYGLDLGYRNKAGFFNLSVQQISPPGYASTSLHAGVGRQLAKDFYAGIRLGVALANYEEYGSDLNPVAQLGIRYKVTKALFAGAHYTYIETKFVPLAEHNLRVGVDYASSERVHLLLSVRQTIGESLAGGFGVSWQAAPRLAFRAGVRTGGTAFSLGVDATVLGKLRLAVTAVAYQDIPVAGSYGIYYH